MASKIIKLFPKHDVYVEPFGGGAGVLLRKPYSKRVVDVYNDIDELVVNFFRCARDMPGELIRVIMATPYSRAELGNAIYTITTQQDDVSELELARAFYITSWMSRSMGGELPTSDKRFKTVYKPIGSKFPNLPCEQALRECLNRLRRVVVECLDFADVLSRYDSKNTLFYVDPPYASHAGKCYDYSLTEQDHIDLYDILSTSDGYVILSAVDSELYRDLYGDDWMWEPIKSLTASSSARTEYLIMNYRLKQDG